MSLFSPQISAFNGRASHFTTPTRRRSVFTASDTELSTVTADGVDRENASFRCGARRGCDGGGVNCTPVRTRDIQVAWGQCGRGAALPSTVRSIAGQLTISPRRRHGSGASFSDSDGLCGPPRVHFALPLSGCRQGTERSQLCEHSCSMVLRDNFADVHVGKVMSPQRYGTRSASTNKATAPLLSITPTEVNANGNDDDPAASKCLFPHTVFESLGVEETCSPNKSLRPPSSPSFSFFSAVTEKRDLRMPATLDSARSEQQPHHGPVVSPRSFAFRTGQSPFSDPASASLSSSVPTVEVKVFSPLCFDSRIPLSVQSQGLSSVTHSHHSSVPLFPPRSANSWWHSDEETDKDVVVVSDMHSATSDGSIRDVVKQQRLLHGCLLTMAREKAELAMEVQRLRQRRFMSLVRLAFHVILRLPFRVLMQFFRIVAQGIKSMAISQPSLTHDTISAN